MNQLGLHYFNQMWE